MKYSPAIKICRTRFRRLQGQWRNYERSRAMLFCSLVLLSAFSPGVPAQPIAPRPSASPVPSPLAAPFGPSPSDDESSSWATYLIQQNPLYRIALVAMVSFAVAALGILVVLSYFRRLPAQRRAASRRKP